MTSESPTNFDTSSTYPGIELVGRAVTGQFRCRLLIPLRRRVESFPCQLCFSAFSILINHSFIHHTSFLMILHLCICLSDLQGRDRKFRTEKIVGYNVVEGLQVLLIAPQSVLTYSHPVLCIGC